MLPAVVLVLVAVLWSIGVVVAQIRCADTARDVARAIARGEPPEEAQRLAGRSAPPGARVAVSRTGDDVAVVVSASIGVPVLGAGASVPVSGSATVQAEPEVP